MYNDTHIKAALLIAGLYKDELHASMLTVPKENLLELRTHIDGITKLINRLKTETKSGDILNKLNKA